MANIAVIGEVTEINHIPDADKIESVTVMCGSAGKWHGIAQKNQFVIGDLCEVFLQDCHLPEIERFAFMSKYQYRVSMRRFLGVPSECVIMPLEGEWDEEPEPGQDIAAVYGCTKYDKPLPAEMEGIAVGHFPFFIPETGEPNFQRVPHMLEALFRQPCVITVKADGVSATTYLHNGNFGCCSRNYELAERPDDLVWGIARRYHVEEFLRTNGLEIALQFEVVGPGIHKNRLGLIQVEPRLFNVWDIGNRRYFDHFEMVDLARKLGMPTVTPAYVGPFTFAEQDLQILAEGKYLTSGKEREGIVIRPLVEQSVRGERLSFKVINLNYRD